MKEEEKSIFPQKCQKIRGETTDCMMNSEGLKQGLKAFLTQFEYMYRLFFFLLLNVKMLIFFLRIVEH